MHVDSTFRWSGRIAIAGMLSLGGATFARGQSPLRAQDETTGTVIAPSPLRLELPRLDPGARGVSTRPITATEAAAQTSATYAEVMTRQPFRGDHYAIDSMRTAVSTASAVWLTRVLQSPTRGIQLDQAGRVGVAAGREPYAQQQIAARLATPGLSIGDRAFAIRTGVLAFSDFYAPARLPIAEQYMRTLDAMGDSAAAWRYEAHASLIWTYYLLGRSADVIRHGDAAIALLERIPYQNRNLFFGQVEEHVYSPTVEALTGQPDGRAHIARLNAQIRAAVTVPSALLTEDKDYQYVEGMYKQGASAFITGNEKLGTAAAPLIAHHWINRGSSDSATVSMNDGKIRVLEFAHTGCLPCVYALYGLERLRKQFPDVEPTLLTWTFGYWGNRLVEPAEEVEQLTKYFVTDTKISFPVGIWSGKKVPNVDGGITPEESPNLKDYPLFGKPMLWIIDGHGTIRRVFTGYNRDVERQMAQTLDFLRREASNIATRASLH